MADFKSSVSPELDVEASQLFMRYLISEISKNLKKEFMKKETLSSMFLEVFELC